MSMAVLDQHHYAHSKATRASQVTLFIGAVATLVAVLLALYSLPIPSESIAHVGASAAAAAVVLLVGFAGTLLSTGAAYASTYEKLNRE